MKHMMASLIVATIGISVIAACSGSPSAETLSRCQTPSQALVDMIAQGLTVTGGGSLRGAQAVKSNDQPNAWFLAADIQGPGLEGPTDIAVWGVGGSVSDLGSVSGILWANVTAHEFSDWGSAMQSAMWSPSTDGIREAEACTKNAL